MAKKRKLKYKNIFKLIFIVILMVFVISYFTLSITNIYIFGSDMKDNDIIEIAGISDYPKLFKTSNFLIKKRLVSSPLIYDSKVYKKGTKLYIEVVDNTPLFYDSNKKATVMKDLSLSDIKTTPYLLNYVPDNIYDEFVEKISKLDKDVLIRISEVEYKPNNVDLERFYLKMNDGNYVYVTLSTFSKLDNYLEMLKQFKGKKGILYLDSGKYFEIKG